MTLTSPEGGLLGGQAWAGGPGTNGASKALRPPGGTNLGETRTSKGQTEASALVGD